MPGLTGIISDHDETELFSSFLSSLNHLDFKTEFYKKDGIHIGRIFHGYINRKKQPVISGNQRYILFFYGEILGFRNIEAQDIPDDALFFLSVFEQNGVEAFKDINGQFIAVIYDLFEKKTYLITDKMGTKPLYYTINRDRLLFSSEVKTLLLDSVDYTLNWKGVSELFHFGHLCGNKTLFQEILLLPPSSYLIFHNRNVSISSYWDLPYSHEVYHRKQKFSGKEKRKYIEELKDVLTVTMQRTYIKKNTSFLFPLSGGLDSRFVVAFAHKSGIDPLKTFTMGPEDSEDQIYASMVAELLGASHEAFSVNPVDFWNDARDFSYLSDGMFTIYGPVAITGPLKKNYKKEEFIVAAQMCDAAFGSTLQLKRVKRIIQKDHFDERNSLVFQEVFNIQREQDLQALFTPEYYTKVRKDYKEIPGQYIKNYQDPAHSYFMMLMHEHVRRGTLGGNVLINNYFEIRMPSYDTDLLEYAFLLPLELREFQYAYRMAFSELFPFLKDVPREGNGLPIDVSNFRLKQKMFFNKLQSVKHRIPVINLIRKNSPKKVTYVDLDGWFREPLKEYMLSFLFDKNNLTKGIFNKEGLEKIVSEHMSGKRDHARLIWQVINLEYFYRNFMD